ncbi:MAG: hypothetical protein AAFP76_00910 [Bacteroidota bacterium]
MSILKSVDKVLAAFGNIRAMERLHVDTFTEEKIQAVDGEMIAQSSQGQLWIGQQELNGYLFLEVVVLSRLNIKTYRGATLIFSSENGDFILPSDTQEIESDYSNISNRYMTRISFDLSKAQLQRIKKGDFEQVQFVFKKKKVLTFLRSNS